MFVLDPSFGTIPILSLLRLRRCEVARLDPDAEFVSLDWDWIRLGDEQIVGSKGLISVDRKTSLLSHVQYPVPYQSRLQRI